jgi:hypothetical protein
VTVVVLVAELVLPVAVSV